MKTIGISVVVQLIAAFLLMLACFRLPIGFYTFLRVSVFVVSVIVILRRKKRFEIIITAFIALLFNPIFPIYLHCKTIWVVLDLLSAGWFVYCSVIKGENNIMKP
ncbi:MAG: hypothetical protein J6Y52_05530 [Bacteroidales bacterium]|nr:hypothetical protein [Bacteroidales bacterium]